MKGKIVNFIKSNNNLSAAAHGPKNDVASKVFSKDLSSNISASRSHPSSGGGWSRFSEDTLNSTDSRNTASKMAAARVKTKTKGSSAGYEGSKSAYIEPKDGGYYKRQSSHTNRIPNSPNQLPLSRTFTRKRNLISDYRAPSIPSRVDYRDKMW